MAVPLQGRTTVLYPPTHLAWYHRTLPRWLAATASNPCRLALSALLVGSRIGTLRYVVAVGMACGSARDARARRKVVVMTTWRRGRAQWGMPRVRWLGLVGLIVGLSTQPVWASYEWCSKDPALTFQRAGALTPYVLDVQVQMPLTVSAAQAAATLTVTLPANVATTVVDASLPVFPLETIVRPVWAPAASDAYGVRLVAEVSQSAEAMPLQLVVTDPTSGLPVTCSGPAGQSVRAELHFAPFEVVCR